MKEQPKLWVEDKRVKIEEEAKKTNLKTFRDESGSVCILKNCEKCNIEIKLQWHDRGVSYCSSVCSNLSKSLINKRRLSNRKTKDANSKEILLKQINIYQKLSISIELVQKKDWETECKNQQVSFRFQTNTPNPYISRNWTDFKQKVIAYEKN